MRMCFCPPADHHRAWLQAEAECVQLGGLGGGGVRWWCPACLVWPQPSAGWPAPREGMSLVTLPLAPPQSAARLYNGSLGCMRLAFITLTSVAFAASSRAWDTLNASRAVRWGIEFLACVDRLPFICRSGPRGTSGSWHTAPWSMEPVWKHCTETWLAWITPSCWWSKTCKTRLASHLALCQRPNATTRPFWSIHCVLCCNPLCYFHLPPLFRSDFYCMYVLMWALYCSSHCCCVGIIVLTCVSFVL